MHIPDGFLDAKTAAATAAVSVMGVGLALRQLRRTFPAYRVPLIGLAAAFIFAAQMLNFPVAGGTSGHLIGGVLAAVLLGPSAAVLVMSSVLILQGLIFADGGVTALGANVLNMALVAPLFGYGIYRAVYGMMGCTLRSRLLAVGFAAWCSTVIAAMVCAAELSLSGTVGWNLAFPAMANIHMLIGIGEAVITTLVVAALAKARPELLADAAPAVPRSRLRQIIGYGLLVSVGLAIFVAPFACAWPDGLEKAAAALGFSPRAADHSILPSPLSDYAVPGLNSPIMGTILAGVIGLLIAFILAYFFARKLTPPDSLD
jgi:cobalt/nickel transport system permease protein